MYMLLRQRTGAPKFLRYKVSKKEAASGAFAWQSPLSKVTKRYHYTNINLQIRQPLKVGFCSKNKEKTAPLSECG
jgi:hypothetical protein